MKALIVSALSLCLTTVNASAAQITVQHEARGWIAPLAGANGRSFEQNFIVGAVDDVTYDDEEFRNWLAFHIPLLTQNEVFVGAELLVNTSIYQSLDPFETYELHHIAAAAGTIGLHGAAHYADLADGPVYGARVFSPYDQNQVVGIPLNDIALADINAAAGRLFEMGGVLTSLAVSPSYSEAVFWGSHVSNFSRLQLTTAIVPEPSSWSMLLAAVPCLAWLAVRRRIGQGTISRPRSWRRPVPWLGRACSSCSPRRGIASGVSPPEPTPWPVEPSASRRPPLARELASRRQTRPWVYRPR